MNPLISVIVPVYNAERYLADCLESLIRQTHRELEILVIDDGSTDGSAALCERFAGQDGRIRLLRKENGGVSSARNLGLDEAQGEYSKAFSCGPPPFAFCNSVCAISGGYDG